MGERCGRDSHEAKPAGGRPVRRAQEQDRGKRGPSSDLVPIPEQTVGSG